MKKILVIEDEELLCEALRLKLSRDGFEIIFANDGAGAFEVIQKVQPDLILLDIVMPHISGLDILKSIKSSDSLSSIPVIVITNLTDKEVETTICNLGVLGYLIKSDSSLDEISTKIQNYFSQVTQ